MLSHSCNVSEVSALQPANKLEETVVNLGSSAVRKAFIFAKAFVSALDKLTKRMCSTFSQPSNAFSPAFPKCKPSSSFVTPVHPLKAFAPTSFKLGQTSCVSAVHPSNALSSTSSIVVALGIEVNALQPMKVALGIVFNDAGS